MSGMLKGVRTHVGMWRRGPGWAAAAAAGCAAGVAAVAYWRFGVDMTAPAVDSAAVDFDPAEVRRSLDYRQGVWALAAAGVVIAPAAAIAAALTWRRWAPWVARVAAQRAWRAGLVFGGGLAVANALVGLPLSAARYAWGRHHGIVTQPLSGWGLDVAKGLAIGTGLSALVGLAAAVAVSRAPRTWWAWLSATGASLVIIGSLVAPLVIEPLFQRTRPLADAALLRDIHEVARVQGVDARTVLVNDASTRTVAANAYVSGYGASRRIVVFDTLLRDFPRDQVRVVVAHELAHVARRHVVWGTGVGAAAMVPIMLLAFAVAGRGGRDVQNVLRVVSTTAAVAAVAGVVAGPVGNVVSRAMEREADRGALQASGDPAAAEGLFRGFVARSRAVPSPPRPVQWWFGTHPTLAERVAAARAWR